MAIGPTTGAVVGCPVGVTTVGAMVVWLVGGVVEVAVEVFVVVGWNTWVGVEQLPTDGL